MGRKELLVLAALVSTVIVLGLVASQPNTAVNAQTDPDWWWTAVVKANSDCDTAANTCADIAAADANNDGIPDDPFTDMASWPDGYTFALNTTEMAESQVGVKRSLVLGAFNGSATSEDIVIEIPTPSDAKQANIATVTIDREDLGNAAVAAGGAATDMAIVVLEAADTLPELLGTDTAAEVTKKLGGAQAITGGVPVVQVTAMVEDDEGNIVNVRDLPMEIDMTFTPTPTAFAAVATVAEDYMDTLVIFVDTPFASAVVDSTAPFTPVDSAMAGIIVAMNSTTAVTGDVDAIIADGTDGTVGGTVPADVDGNGIPDILVSQVDTDYVAGGAADGGTLSPGSFWVFGGEAVIALDTSNTGTLSADSVVTFEAAPYDEVTVTTQSYDATADTLTIVVPPITANRLSSTDPISATMTVTVSATDTTEVLSVPDVIFYPYLQVGDVGVTAFAYDGVEGTQAEPLTINLLGSPADAELQLPATEGATSGFECDTDIVPVTTGTVLRVASSNAVSATGVFTSADVVNGQLDVPIYLYSAPGVTDFPAAITFQIDFDETVMTPATTTIQGIESVVAEVGDIPDGLDKGLDLNADTAGQLRGVVSGGPFEIFDDTADEGILIATITFDVLATEDCLCTEVAIPSAELSMADSDANPLTGLSGQGGVFVVAANEAAIADCEEPAVKQADEEPVYVFGLAAASQTLSDLVDDTNLPADPYPGWNFSLHLYDSTNFLAYTKMAEVNTMPDDILTGGELTDAALEAKQNTQADCANTPADLIILTFPTDLTADDVLVENTSPDQLLVGAWSTNNTLGSGLDDLDAFAAGTTATYQSGVIAGDFDGNGNVSVRLWKLDSGATSVTLRQSDSDPANDDKAVPELDTFTIGVSEDTPNVTAIGDLRNLVEGDLIELSANGGLGWVVEVILGDAANTESATPLYPGQSEYGLCVEVPAGLTGVHTIELIGAGGVSLGSITVPAAGGDDDDDDGPCFIATAAYGTPMASEIDTLRAMRDTYMLSNPVGTALADTYYRVSPAIADAVAKSPLLAATMRVLLTPVVMVSKLALAVPHLMLGLVMLAVAAFMARRASRSKA